MTRLAHDRAGVARPEELKEPGSHPRVKGVRRRELHEQGPSPPAQTAGLIEKPFQRQSCLAQLQIMCDGAGKLDREAKARRRRSRPPCIRDGGMRAMEGRVDLGAAENARVTLEVRALDLESVC